MNVEIYNIFPPDFETASDSERRTLLVAIADGSMKNLLNAYKRDPANSDIEITPENLLTLEKALDFLTTRKDVVSSLDVEKNALARNIAECREQINELKERFDENSAENFFGDEHAMVTKSPDGFKPNYPEVGL